MQTKNAVQTAIIKNKKKLGQSRFTIAGKIEITDEAQLCEENDDSNLLSEESTIFLNNNT